MSSRPDVRERDRDGEQAQELDRIKGDELQNRLTTRLSLVSPFAFSRPAYAT
jgi:hypothetical protein